MCLLMTVWQWMTLKILFLMKFKKNTSSTFQFLNIPPGSISVCHWSQYRDTYKTSHGANSYYHRLRFITKKHIQGRRKRHWLHDGILYKLYTVINGHTKAIQGVHRSTASCREVHPLLLILREVSEGTWGSKPPHSHNRADACKGMAGLFF